jgi:hypothetical protein
MKRACQKSSAKGRQDGDIPRQIGEGGMRKSFRIVAPFCGQDRADGSFFDERISFFFFCG